MSNRFLFIFPFYVDSSDIVDNKLKLILGLIWTLILHYSISLPMWEGEEGDSVFDKKVDLHLSKGCWDGFKVNFRICQ